MTTILNIISKACREAFAAAGFDPTYGKVNLSNRPDLCEYQCNGAMAAAKQYGKKPIDIANAVVEQLGETALEGVKLFESCSAVMPGFINLNLSKEYLARYLNEMAELETLGLGTEAGGKTIVIDYGGANVAKPLHVGHLRSAVIGEAVKRLAAKVGNHVIGDVHLGDWGLQMGLIIAELEDRGRLEADFTISELEEVYPAASAKAKAKDEAGNLLHPEFAQRAHEATAKLQNGDPICRAVWKHIMEVSLADLRKNYDSLNVSFDLWKGESDAQPYIPGLIQDLTDRGIAHESEGALVVDVTTEQDPKELPPCIIRKSDGAALYATSDLGTIIEREKDLKPDTYIYITDNRQSLHFTQVFRVAKMAGYVPEDRRMIHIGFGTMNGKDGKPFKTRDGGVLRLETLIHDTEEQVYQRIQESRGDSISEEEARGIAKIVGLAALKYGDLSNQATKDYVFDLDRFTAFEGNTGPYILYTIVRIKSILAKYGESLGDGTSADALIGTYRVMPVEAKSGHDLSLLLARYSDVVLGAWEELAPHKLCSYIYEVSNAFNSFYHDVKILAEPDVKKQQGYLALLKLTRDVLLSCIDVLGFEAPDKM